ncbi:unnamed protein product [Sphagnum balticum]
MRQELKDNNLVVKDLTEKLSRAEDIIDKLEQENIELKGEIEEVHDKSQSHINDSKKQEKDLDFLKTNYEKNSNSLREKEANAK